MGFLRDYNWYLFKGVGILQLGVLHNLIVTVMTGKDRANRVANHMRFRVQIAQSFCAQGWMCAPSCRQKWRRAQSTRRR